jgi:predicted ATPase
VAVPFLKSVEIRATEDDLERGHPFDVPAIASMVTKRSVLRFDPAMTVFVGDNGSGKSTLLEAVAVHQGLNAEGGARGMQFGTTERSVSSLHRHLRVNRTARQPRDAFFLRAESYFNVATAIDGYGSAAHYGGSPHQRSHGESLHDLVVHRFGSNSLFVLDEPEAALSVHGQLQLLVRIHDLIDQGCQFIVATHSPLLMAYPDATIYEFGAHGPTPTTWSQIDTVHITTDFLDDPTGFLTELFADDDV